jgi:6-phosphogluconolactonase
VVHPTGKYIYATVRGHDSVSVFAADEKTGALTFVQNISAAGKIPRGLGVDPTGHWLVVANQKTDNVTVFAIDAATGKLTPTDQKISIGAPVDVKFLKID